MAKKLSQADRGWVKITVMLPPKLMSQLQEMCAIQNDCDPALNFTLSDAIRTTLFFGIGAMQQLDEVD